MLSFSQLKDENHGNLWYEALACNFNWACKKLWCPIPSKNRRRPDYSSNLCPPKIWSIWLFWGFLLGPLPVLFLVEKAQKHPLKKSYRSYFRRAQIRWVIWPSSKKVSINKMTKNRQSGIGGVALTGVPKKSRRSVEKVSTKCRKSLDEVSKSLDEVSKFHFWYNRALQLYS